MTDFNIVHIVNDTAVGLKAYLEVIESVRWGLQQLGHNTTYSVNSYSSTTMNIVFGGHFAPRLLFENRANLIYYNLEQIRGHPQFTPDAPAEMAAFISSNLRIWDYSEANIETWNRLSPKYPVRFMPICYAPILTRIAKAETQDIDVLIYGVVGKRRLSAFSMLGNLVNLGISTLFACGLYGDGRDELIGRSKIVLNINNVAYSKIFEIVRVSYLLANAKAVVADISPDTHIESDIVNGVVCVPLEQIPETCMVLLNDYDHRTALERRGFEAISRRDICAYLQAALVPCVIDFAR